MIKAFFLRNYTKISKQEGSRAGVREGPHE